MTTVKYYFDYYSPYAYLASTQLPKQGFEVEYCPVSVLDVMDMVHNQPTPKCPAKLAYIMRDTARWAQRYSVPLQMNEQFWSGLQSNVISTRLFIRGALAAQQLGHFDAYHRGMSDAIWRHPRDVVSEAGRMALLQEWGVPAQKVWDLARTKEIDSRLDQRNTEAAAAGVFGVPIFIVDDEMYFGNDRLDLVIQHAARLSNSQVPA
jgi:2-hydroxychromene-2-carboxylate isomerase